MVNNFSNIFLMLQMMIFCITEVFLLCCECITRCQVSMPEKAVKLVCEFLFGYVGQATVSSPAVFSPPSGFCHVEFQNACISV